MYGNNFTRSLRVLGNMVKRPQDVPAWFGNAFSRKRAVDMSVPWMSWSSIAYLNQHVKSGWRVFEWGGGGSTRYFLQRGCVVTTVESNEYWKGQIEQVAEKDGFRKNLTVRHIPAETKSPDAVRDYIQSVHDGGPWNLILVDGLEEDYISRVQCIAEVARESRPGTLVVLDDAWRENYAVIPGMLPGWRHLRFRSLGPARFGVTQSDVFIAP